MPSIYPQLKKSDRKYIRTQKASIRRNFLDAKKQEEMISELYARLLGAPKKAEVVKEVKATKKEKVKK